MAERDRERVGPLGVVAVGMTVLAALVYMAGTRDAEVGTSDFVLGLLLGTAGIGLLPAAAYYALGRSLASRPGVLFVIWAVSQVPLAFYLFVVLIFAVGLTHCPPDAYECPL